MTINEISQKYNIPLSILKEYESFNYKSDYDENDLEKITLMITLHDLNFTNEEIEKYMIQLLNNNKIYCLKQLCSKRKELLEEVHDKEKQLSIIDYLKKELS